MVVIPVQATLRQVLPVQTLHYLPNSRMGNVVLSGKLSTSNKASVKPCAYIQHLFSRKLRCIDSLALCMTNSPSVIAAFTHHVLTILSLSAKPKMNRITAQTDITRMTDAQIIRNSTIGQKPSEAMGTPKQTIITNQAITSQILCTCPKPTITSFIHTEPERLRSGLWRHSHLPFGYYATSIVQQDAV